MKVLVPEGVAISRFVEIRLLLAQHLGDEDLSMHVSYHPTIEGRADHGDLVRAELAGEFNLLQCQCAAERLSAYFTKQYGVEFVRDGAPILQMGLLAG